ncbi:hypothetical protein BFN67_14260 [Pseudaminobacter manganicus]|uniref:DUF4424 domain-containing protein n=1 Tax=Manganibacter manganicus TaxID=1873176 RepID=A0A1V8RTU1_9HYPH|nr:hypothetical protein BFN67_14260 [Pseudaminobacter manganicus]
MTLISGVLIGLCFPTAALANGAMASFPAGGVIFHQNEHVSIEREDLTIGLERIHVHYVFRSSADRPLQLTIGFPMPKMMLDGGTNMLILRSASETDLRNYMAFEVKANGKPIQPKLHEYGWMNGTNVTAQLQSMQIPVLLADPSFFELQNLPQSTLDALMEANLVESYGEDPFYYPRWKYQTVYEWQQTFPPGERTVDITYVPLYGVETTEGKYSLFPGTGNTRYCYDDAFKTRFDAQHAYFEPMQLSYLLKTARNWSGPIGAFQLKIENPEGYLFSFCPPAGLKTGGAGFRPGIGYRHDLFLPGSASVGLAAGNVVKRVP